MSYDPSHRRPPRQERWPTATPPEGWPSYRDGEQADGRYGADRPGAYPAVAGYLSQDGYQHASGGYGSVATDTSPPAGNGNGYRAGGYPLGRHAGSGTDYARGADAFAGRADDFAEGGNGYGATGGNGYGATSGYATDTGNYAMATSGYATATGNHAMATSGYATATGNHVTADGYGYQADEYGHQADGYGYDWNADGYAGAADDFAGPDGYPGPGRYDEPAFPDPLLAAPDAGVHPDSWQAGQDRRREAARRGLAVSGVTGFLAVAVAIGVSTLAAAVLRSQVAPVSAVGGVFVDRTPATLRNLALQHFGAHGRDALLLAMYAAIAVFAIAAGMLARRAAALGVAAIAAFTLVAAFVTITRMGSQVADVIPAVIGGLAGVVALAWLVGASTPSRQAAPLRYARGARRRA